jgi:hypothetical protein
MRRLPIRGARIETPRQTEGELKSVLRNLGVAQALDEAAVNKLFWKLGEVIGQWSSEQERLEVSPVAQAFRSIANNLSQTSRLLRGLETGIRSDLEIAVSSRVADLLSMEPTIHSRSAQDILRSFCADADRIAHVCLVATVDLPQGPAERGRRAHKWYDAFTALLLQIANKAGVAPTLRKDRITRVRSGWLLDAALSLENFLDPLMRSPSSEACGKRLERSLGHSRKTKRQKSSDR